MATVPVTRTWVAGEVVTAAHFNTNIRDVLQFLLAPPIFEGRQTVAQNIPTSAWTAVTLDAEDVDSAGGHSLVTNTSRYTAVYPGWYSSGWGGAIESNATGVRGAILGKNTTLQNGSQTLLTANNGFVTAIPGRGGKKTFLNVSDYLELYLFQSSGAGRLTGVSGAEQPNLSINFDSN